MICFNYGPGFLHVIITFIDFFFQNAVLLRSFIHFRDCVKMTHPAFSSESELSPLTGLIGISPVWHMTGKLTNPVSQVSGQVGWLDNLEIRPRLNPAWLKLELGLSLTKLILHNNITTIWPTIKKVSNKETLPLLWGRRMENVFLARLISIGAQPRLCCHTQLHLWFSSQLKLW